MRIESITNSREDYNLFDVRGYGIRDIDGVHFFVNVSTGRILPDSVSVIGKKVDGLVFMGLEETMQALEAIPDYIENFYRIVEAYRDRVKRVEIVEVAR